MSTDIRELMLAGAHFGHRARFWNPKMKPYIYGEYHSTHIIDLDQTMVALDHAMRFLTSVVSSNGVVLFVCTKRAGSKMIEDEAKSVSMPYVNHRWLGGMLTNFKTTRKSVDRLIKIENEVKDGILKDLTKKEGIKLIGAKSKLEKSIGGIYNMTNLPDALFVIDAGWHKGAVSEANKLGIPVLSIVDTNHAPDNIDYVIPGNDDSGSAISIYLREATLAIAKGKKEFEKNLLNDIQSGKSVAADIEQQKNTSAVPPSKIRKTSSLKVEPVVEEVAEKKERVIRAKKTRTTENKSNVK